MTQEERAYLRSLGLLDQEPEERTDPVEEDAGTRAAFQEAEEITAALALTAPQVAPPPSLKARLMLSIRKPAGLTEVAPGLRVAFQRDAIWKKTPFPGVTYRLLFADPSTGISTCLLRMAPGSVYPAHKHVAPEQALILEGDCFQGSVYLQTGDYQLADGQTIHEPIRSDGGCLILVMASQHDELLP